jgi:radical SAM superfamily enzyme with C-terminal helix-hairpin-helix motif
MKACIIDGYVDEPSCLGVPPYISPYPRYIYGMLRDVGIKTLYITIDHLRNDYRLKKSLYSYDLIIVIAGMVVPGKYIGGKPLSLKELINLLPANLEEKVLVGPIVLEMSEKDRLKLETYRIFDFPFERELLVYLSEKAKKERRSLDAGRDFINRFAILGAEVVKQHPDFPHIICEIETYRGCYWRKCSFCIERIHGIPSMRSPEGVINEIQALYESGCRHFRLGNQTDFFTYLGDFSSEVPKPNPQRLKEFHREIWRRCPRIKTLHLDNVNPKTIAEYPEESREVVKIIVQYQTPGNICAMGLESADEKVIRDNNLAVSKEEVLFAIEIVNRYGKYYGYNGMPYFLPGLNFVFGLKGERKETFEINYEFLRDLVEKGLFLRRINIRQVKIFKNTPMEKIGDRYLKKHRRYFLSFKERVRRDVDKVLLKKMFPKGRKLTDLRCEIVQNKITFARQFGTYPLLVGVIGSYKRDTFIDVRIVDHGERSLTAIKYPLDVKSVTKRELEAIGSIPKEVLDNILIKRDLGTILQNLNDSKVEPLLKKYFASVS